MKAGKMNCVIPDLCKLRRKGKENMEVISGQKMDNQVVQNFRLIKMEELHFEI